MNGTIGLRNIELSYGARRVLAGLDLDLLPGRCILLCGDNGAGKSSLLRVLAGLQPADRITVTGQEIPSPRRVARLLRDRTTYLHQHPYAFRGTVERNVAYALPRGGERVGRRARVEEALSWAGLDHLARDDATRLSGGERQRLALARARLRPSPFLLLDEPTANLDGPSRGRTLELLHTFLEEGRGLVVATHDPAHFAPVCDIHLRLEGGRLRLAPPVSPPLDRAVEAG